MSVSILTKILGRKPNKQNRGLYIWQKNGKQIKYDGKRIKVGHKIYRNIDNFEVNEC